MYTLYIANKNYSSWSLRPWVLMTELGIPFKEVLNSFDEGSNWNKFRTFSPSGLVPCLMDGDRIIWDSLAIIEYLAETHPEIWPSNIDARTWARCATSEMHAGFFEIRNQCPMNCGVEVEFGTINVALQKELDRLDELWNQGLSNFKGPFLAGPTFTAVDAFFAPIAFRLRSYGLELSTETMNYVEHMLSIDSMQSWYQAAIKETWREPGHEADTVQNGKIIQDHRAI